MKTMLRFIAMLFISYNCLAQGEWVDKGEYKQHTESFDKIYDVEWSLDGKEILVLGNYKDSGDVFVRINAETGEFVDFHNYKDQYKFGHISSDLKTVLWFWGLTDVPYEANVSYLKCKIYDIKTKDSLFYINIYEKKTEMPYTTYQVEPIEADFVYDTKELLITFFTSSHYLRLSFKESRGSTTHNFFKYSLIDDEFIGEKISNGKHYLSFENDFFLVTNYYNNYASSEKMGSKSECNTQLFKVYGYGDSTKTFYDGRTCTEFSQIFIEDSLLYAKNYKSIYIWNYYTMEQIAVFKVEDGYFCSTPMKDVFLLSNSDYIKIKNLRKGHTIYELKLNTQHNIAKPNPTDSLSYILYNNNYLSLYKSQMFEGELNAFFSADSVKTFIDTSLHFYDYSSGNPTSWHWDFGDGNSSTEQNPSHIYSEKGLYDVTLIVSDGIRSDTLIKKEYIAAKQYIKADFKAEPTSGEYPLTVNFINKSIGEDLQYTWKYNKGVFSTDKDAIGVFPFGTYDITLEITDGYFISSKTKYGYINSHRTIVDILEKDIDKNLLELRRSPDYKWCSAEAIKILNDYQAMASAQYFNYIPSYYFETFLLDFEDSFNITPLGLNPHKIIDIYDKYILSSAVKSLEVYDSEKDTVHLLQLNSDVLAAKYDDDHLIVLDNTNNLLFFNHDLIMTDSLKLKDLKWQPFQNIQAFLLIDNKDISILTYNKENSNTDFDLTLLRLNSNHEEELRVSFKFDTTIVSQGLMKFTDCYIISGYFIDTKQHIFIKSDLEGNLLDTLIYKDTTHTFITPEKINDGHFAISGHLNNKIGFLVFDKNFERLDEFIFDDRHGGINDIHICKDTSLFLVGYWDTGTQFHDIYLAKTIPLNYPVPDTGKAPQDTTKENPDLPVYDRDYLISPNPVKDYFVLKGNSLDSGMVTLEIHDSYGNLYQSVEFEAGTAESKKIYMRSAAPGMYFARIKKHGKINVVPFAVVR
ncbi:MAG: PKD domain-containing protein [Candidatus Kapaibacterium sp.]